MKSVSAFFFFAALAAFATHPRDAAACSTLGERPFDVPAIDSDVPSDGPIGVIVTTSGTLNVEVTTKDGTPIAITNVASAEPRLRWIRPVKGDFPEGPLTVRVTGSGAAPLEAHVRVAGKIADYQLSVDAPALSSEIAPDEASPKIRCGGAFSESSCGPHGDTDLASRWRRSPRMTFVDHDPAWVGTLFGKTHRWTVTHADGTVDTEITSSNDHRFESIGVQYCVEVMRAPMPGVAASPKSDRHCIEDDGSAFGWSDAENEAQLVSTSKSWGCKTLDFPPGTDVPDELEDEAGTAHAGCDIGARSRGGTSTTALVALAISVLLLRGTRSRATVLTHDGDEDLQR